MFAVTEKALVQRINRKLVTRRWEGKPLEGELVRKTRPARGQGWSNAEINLGTYYTVDINRNFVTRKHIDLEELGRELGVLGDNETVMEARP